MNIGLLYFSNIFLYFFICFDYQKGQSILKEENGYNYHILTIIYDHFRCQLNIFNNKITTKTELLTIISPYNYSHKYKVFFLSLSIYRLSLKSMWNSCEISDHEGIY